ncbi:hypothetical protein GLAREA_09887 [Glarea lozoyensis ATCC 20868]|uniref:Uncharacterized protein n=1 Tax=Glarea lozoyensis (strain ATCC 20868 / MF5171) TaxID=1116229 RepID=S3D9X0_GLAL2|nr:uncharacterized protein GLAREA_09887 [Glarea lozoyensis ATCC 20868]EPE28766.1 hypothetical protein GLAREA_09887 [Glarea lozoyensis ATCC 20868]
MSEYTLSIVTYERGERWDDIKIKKPYHWLFFLAPSNQTSKMGQTYQLRGMSGGFYYQGDEDLDLKEPPSAKEILEVETIPADKIERFGRLLESVKVKNDESSKWNCQSWSLEVLDILRLEGFVSEDYPNNVVQNWLRED